MEKCWNCNGTGWENNDHYEKDICSECNGEGELEKEKPLGVSDLDWNLKLVGMSQKDFC